VSRWQRAVSGKSMITKEAGGYVAEITIDMIPRGSFYNNLRSHLSKNDWDIIRRACYQKAGYACEVCGGKGDKWPVECHEIWSFDDEKQVQKLEGTIALCPACHQVKHFGLATVHHREGEAKAHMMKVNGWTDDIAEKHIKAAWALWKHRSNMSWEFDLSWLEKNGVSLAR